MCLQEWYSFCPKKLDLRHFKKKKKEKNSYSDTKINYFLPVSRQSLNNECQFPSNWNSCHFFHWICSTIMLKFTVDKKKIYHWLCKCWSCFIKPLHSCFHSIFTSCILSHIYFILPLSFRSMTIVCMHFLSYKVYTIFSESCDVRFFISLSFFSPSSL